MSTPQTSYDHSRTSIPKPPPLPQPKIVHVGTDCALEYIDLKPAEIGDDPETTITLVLLHGAPGTYLDFRYLIPHIQQKLPTARIIGINFPGFGGSSVDESRYFELLNAQRAAQLTLEALSQLVAPDENVFLVGHSFGGHAALTIASLNSSMGDTKAELLNVKGLVLLTAAGMTPHRVLQPRVSGFFVNALQTRFPVVRLLLSTAIKLFYTKVLRFPSYFPASHFVAGIFRAGTTDFDVVTHHVAVVRRARLPSFSAWSANDDFMEDEIPTALAQALGSSKCLAFALAGHNIQKTRAEVLTTEMTQWMKQVLHGEATEGMSPIDDLP